MDATFVRCGKCNQTFTFSCYICGAMHPTCSHCGHCGPVTSVPIDISTMLMPPPVGYAIPKLKSVTEHNEERRKARQEREAAIRKTGVACPGCGEELLWPREPHMLTAEYVFSSIRNHTRKASCAKCPISVELEL